jgi:DNA ligase D-like protein (predicted ligase)
MLPTLASEIPTGEEWLYEIKYDGFRTMIYFEKNSITMVSRNLNRLNEQFPETIEYFSTLSKQLSIAPAIIDGELCVLDSKFKANFDKIQQRGRLKKHDKIVLASKSIPVTFLAFDIVMRNNVLITNSPLVERKKILLEVFNEVNQANPLFQLVDTYEDSNDLWAQIKKAHGEGIVAKRKDSQWEEGKRSIHWLKIKNLVIATFFVLAYDENNSFFHIGCIQNGEIKLIGKVGQGFQKEEKEALISIVKNNTVKQQQRIMYINPSICVEVEFLEISKNELRHPKFRRFRFDKHWEDCSWESIQKIVQK